MREREAQNGTLPLTEVRATNFGRPYKPSIYTPKLGHKPFWHIRNMACPLMDSVNTVIRCPYSTLCRNGVFQEIRKRKEKYIGFTDLQRG
jgi:hypothetical protein